MVLRTSEPIQVQGSRGTPDVQLSSARTVGPDFAKFASGPSTADRLISTLTKVGTNLASKAFDAHVEEKYLEGVAQVGQVQSEEELQTNPLTSDWVKAGFRDTTGRLKMAEAQAELTAKMPALAKGTPEEFQAYLAQQRSTLVPHLQGMSRQQRAGTFGQLALDQATATKKYTAARTAYVQKVEQSSIQAAMTVRRENMDLAKSDPAVYADEVNNFTATMYKDIMLNPKLTDSTKQDMLRQAAEYAASSDNVAVYQQMKNQKFQFPDGTEGTLMSRMSFEDQIKVDKAQRQAMDRVKVYRAGEFETTVAQMTAEWQNPALGVTQEYSDVVAVLDKARDNGILSPGKRETVLKAYFTAVAKNGIDQGLAVDFANGNVQALFSKNKSQDDGLKAYLKANKGKDLPTTVNELLSIGNNHGMDSALGAAGELMKPAIAQLGYGDDINPENAQMIHNTVNALNTSEASNPGANSKFLSAFNEEGRDMFLYMREAQRNGIVDPVVAVKYARQQMLDAKNLGGLQDALVARANTEDAVVVQDIGDRQLLGTMSSTVSSWFSRNAATEKRLGTGRAWFENEDRTAEVRAAGQIALAQELAVVAKTNPSMSADGRKTKALAALSARVVDTDSGPLIMPRGQTLQGYFGVPPHADQAYVGRAIDELHKPAPGGRVAYNTTPDGLIMFREFNAQGQVSQAGTINPKDVGRKVQENLDRDATTASGEVGPGIIIRGNGGQVQVNGENTAGAAPAAMLALRQDIVTSEGVRNTAYADSGGRSFGVGIHTSNPNFQQPLGPDGTYTQQQISQSFLQASDAAANLAAKSMKTVGVQGGSWLRFFGELAYQSPNSARDEDMLAYIAVGDKEGALTALKKTPAYKNSPADRQERYVQKLERAMR